MGGRCACAVAPARTRQDTNHGALHGFLFHEHPPPSPRVVLCSESSCLCFFNLSLSLFVVDAIPVMAQLLSTDRRQQTQLAVLIA